MNKRLLVLSIYLCLSVVNYGQGKPSVQIQVGLSLSEFNFTKDYIDPTFMQNIPERANHGYSIGMFGELPISQSQSLIFGIASSQINNYPKVDYGLWYGLVVQKDGEQLYISPSYLERLRFDLIELPVSWRFYLSTDSKNIQPFLGLGMTTSFSWQEKERWKSMLDQEQVIDIMGNEPLYEYEEKENNFRHFRTAFTFNLGSSFQLNYRISLILDLQANLIEHRQAQESIVVDWIPEFWETEISYLSQFSLNVGLQSSF
jgi:hypothetical protein